MSVHDKQALRLSVMKAQWPGHEPEAGSSRDNPASSLDSRVAMTAATTAEAMAAEPITFNKRTSTCASTTTWSVQPKPRAWKLCMGSGTTSAGNLPSTIG
ncbi:hypothetical protein ACD578_12380 [Microvirga sp. RSM25]|uniref:hypothetical protein n=1 Tax=Microvirga sp. RSM25 TaxID=3273802 RepID=UPI00385027E9